METTQTTAPACRSCGSHESTRPDTLCDGCGHAVDHHGARVSDAYAVECDGSCRRTAAALLGRRGGQAGTERQLAQRRAAAVRGGRPTLLLLVDDLGRDVGITTVSSGRVGEVVEYGSRVPARTRPDGYVESATFRVEGRARLVRLPRMRTARDRADRLELERDARRWDVQ